jgi:hypothetical protein
MIANSGRLRSVSESCLGDSFPVLPAKTHSAVEECAFGRPNELSKCRDKIGLDDGVTGLYQYVCVRKRSAYAAYPTSRMCWKTTRKASKLSNKLAICKRCRKGICLFGLITSARKGLRRAGTANEHFLRGSKPSISVGDARWPFDREGRSGNLPKSAVPNASGSRMLLAQHLFQTMSATDRSRCQLSRQKILP